LLFLSLRRPPPRSPLFPYTTLFRSCAAGAGGDHGRVHHAGTAAFVFLPGHHCPSAGLRRAHAIVAPGAAAGPRGACGRWPSITPRNTTMHYLVCGGAGYIGSHMAQWLSAHGHKVTVLDNFSTGRRQAVRWGDLVEADLLDPATLQRAFDGHRYDAVLHFCASSLVGESVREPYAYYRNNVAGTLNLLEAMRQNGVERLVFSSTAAVYGNPVSGVIDEDHPKAPIN